MGETNVVSIVLNAGTFILVAGIVFQGGKFIGEVRTMLKIHDDRIKALEDK